MLEKERKGKKKKATAEEREEERRWRERRHGEVGPVKLLKPRCTSTQWWEGGEREDERRIERR